MPQIPLSITSLGAIARRALAQAQQAAVWGVTSHGIFLHLSSDWVIFLSFDQYRGPLTLNSNLSPLWFQKLKPGSTVITSSNTLNFDSLGIEVNTDSAQVWSASARETPSPANLAGRFDRLEYICQKVLAARKDSISNDLIADSIVALSPVVLGARAALEKCLGLGEGLTPAGDDLVLGYLLAINRWGDLLCPEQDGREINQTIRQAAHRKTNTLSANLIECASLGQADERLIQALDGIMTGEPDPDTCVTLLLSWGHTSGMYVLAGMAWAIIGTLPRVIAR